MDTIYKQLIDELNKNGYAKTLTIISDNENIGRKVISHSDSSMDSIDYVSRNIENIVNSSVNDEDREIFKSVLKDIEFKKGTYICKSGSEEIFVEDIAGKPNLIICGGGHIALPLSRMGKMLEFNVTVIDNREEFANEERFPHADNVICRDFDEALEDADINGNTYIVIVTRGHKDDRRCLEKVIRTNHKYVGMIGSRAKVASVFKAMIEEGYTEEELKTVHSPVGLKIGAQTPEEIAVSIFAEIIEVKNKKLWFSIEDDIMDKLKCAQTDMVLATIVEKTGSTPRGVGAKMLVSEDGSFLGTVGGGSVENAVYEKSKELIKSKKSHIEKYDLSNSKASKLGMACGGTVRVLFEYIKAGK